MANFTTDGKICIERELKLCSSVNKFNDIITRFDSSGTCKWINDNNFTKVCLQFPDTLLNVSAQIYQEIAKKVDVDLYILGDTSYASCCVDSVAAMHVNADAIIHYGNTCFTKTNIPVYTVLPKAEINVNSTMKILSTNFHYDENIKLCLFYSTEFDHCKEALAPQWFKAFPTSYLAYVELEDKPERFLGRIIKDASGNEYSLEILKNCLCVYIGYRGQTFFNYTISIPASEWYLLDMETNKVDRLDETTWFKRRRYLVEKCKDANVVGILVCKLAGEQTKEIISRMKQLCKVNGKKSYIVSVGKPNVAKLANFPEIDIYVMIACPENDLYSNRDFYKPIVYPYELEVALNSNRDPYMPYHITDYDDLLPGKRHHCGIQNIKETVDVSLITGKIRKITIDDTDGTSQELAEQPNWALESVGQNLQDRTWTGLEQRLGETAVKKAEEGRKGIPLQYSNEPE